MSRGKLQLDSSKPQRLASSDVSGTVAPVPQLAQLMPTSSAGGLVPDHCALLIMKDPEPQLWQANSLCNITRRRHRDRSPDGYMPSGYHALYLCAFRHVLLAFLPPRIPNFTLMDFAGSVFYALG